jgi:hypothetical protein
MKHLSASQSGAQSNQFLSDAEIRGDLQMSENLEASASRPQSINSSGSLQSDEDDHRVGYKRPPKATQFKKGQSGNPKGRLKRPIVNDLRVLLDQVLAEPHTVREGGRLRTTTTLHAIILAYMNTGLKANPAALRRLFRLAERIGMLTRLDTSDDSPYQLVLVHEGEEGNILRMYRAEKESQAQQTAEDARLSVRDSTNDGAPL